ncbi:MAG: YkgJ family cysteine cluster protein [Sphaerochaetaceae bacterium]|nr:YkgJ family cysteine cluster protein [Sphaerochaetaceae bacterium]
MECFYEDGLAFTCLPGCRYCCAVEPGFVFLSMNDLQRLCSFTQKPVKDFVAEFCIKVPMGSHHYLSLKERDNHDCIFLGEKGCTVYESRPVQCSTYPFWAHVLSSGKSWEEEKKWCPGIGKGVLHSKEKIDEQLSLRKENQPLIFEELDMSLILS